MAANVESVLRDLLPPGWQLHIERARRLATKAVPDILVTLTAPNGMSVVFVGEIKNEGAGSQMRTALKQLQRDVAEIPEARPLFIAPWISRQARSELASEGAGFIDATGNVRLTADSPGLLVMAEGADRNPWPLDKALQSLRGRGAARALRALLDFTPPYGIRTVANRSGASAATISRVAAFLEGESLLDRSEHGTCLRLDSVGTIRRWAQDYDVLRSNVGSTYLQSRGLPALTPALETTSFRYAVTGSLAANLLAPIAPTRLAMVYVDDLNEASISLDLRPAEAGGNVVLLEPYDEVVYSRSLKRSGLRVVNPSQLAVDLLTGPGRAPSEGEELLTWMKDNTDAWRT